MSQRPSPIFKHEFGQAIWQMALDATQGLLALELRDLKEASVTFSLVDLHKGNLVFDGYAFEEEWWMGLVALRDNLLLIKQYHDSQQPEKQGLLAVNVKTMDVQWWLDNFQLLQMDGQTVTGKQHDEGESMLKQYSISTGDELSADSLNESTPDEAANNASYPIHYTNESPHFETVQAFIATHFNVQAAGACDYLEAYNKIIISWFYSEGSSYTNVLSVLDADGQIVIEEKLGTGLDALAADTFFVLENKLIFVANKTQLLVYELFETA